MRNISAALKFLAAIVLGYPAAAATDSVPKLDVAQSCRAAQAIAGEDKNLTYKGCMQDEAEAQKQLAQKWSKFKAEDRRNCVAQGISPLPSYVEILTCLEMYDQASTLYRPADRYSPTQPESVPPALPPTQLPAPLPQDNSPDGKTFDMR